MRGRHSKRTRTGLLVEQLNGSLVQPWFVKGRHSKRTRTGLLVEQLNGSLVQPWFVRGKHGRRMRTRSVVDHFSSLNINAWILFFLFIYLVIIVKITTLEKLSDDILYGCYSVGVSLYILSRFATAHFHPDREDHYAKEYEPTLVFGIPSKNEEGRIRETILRIAGIDYPKDKFEIIAINDGSSDNTIHEMRSAQRTAAEMGVSVRVVDWRENRGKRHGMARCVKMSTGDIVIFIDSDSFIDHDAPRELVKYFADRRVGAVAGHAFVANADRNILTKMQAVRYFVAFKAYKGSEGVFGAVSCCSGCCSAYRREYLEEIIDDWLGQRFLGVNCTYGDDRSLTNFMLKRGHRAMYSEKAVSHTFVPDSFQHFMNQQLRWKKSWIRESARAATFMWKRHPLASVAFYLGILLPLLSPVIVCRAILWFPVSSGRIPWFYLSGLLLMSIIYGLYYHVYTRDRKWVYGVVFAAFYTLILVWQLPYAIASLRNSSWGTR